jgi:hypothetical protein
VSTLAPAPAHAEPQHIHSSGGRTWRWIAASSAVAAAGLHLAAAVEHAGAHDVVVGFFLFVAFAQLGLGAWVIVSSWAGLRPDVRLVTLALLGTVALVGLYLLAHTTDLLAAFSAHDTASHGGGTDAPQGHSTATGAVALGLEPVPVREPAGLLGTATVTVEMVTVLALTAALPARWKGRAVNGLLLLGGLAWALWLAGVIA